ncbi:MAG: ORF6N domain-containing protein [Candidatus Marinimicrobia bacterium]|nr:ORF6N domain-containing protein [Candidatus Neomarinimicrobiota bacterium]
MVMLDYDLAELYGVETKHINQAVRNNTDKFPSDFIFELNEEEFEGLRSKFLTANLK